MNIEELICRVIIDPRFRSVGVKDRTTWPDLRSGKIEMQIVSKYTGDTVPLTLDLNKLLSGRGKLVNCLSSKGKRHG